MEEIAKKSPLSNESSYSWERLISMKDYIEKNIDFYKGSLEHETMEYVKSFRQQLLKIEQELDRRILDL
jgi:hypothetical protein